MEQSSKPFLIDTYPACVYLSAQLTSKYFSHHHYHLRNRWFIFNHLAESNLIREGIQVC